jgi:hypothetical protein
MSSRLYVLVSFKAYDSRYLTVEINPVARMLKVLFHPPEDVAGRNEIVIRFDRLD